MADNFFGLTDVGRQRDNNEDAFIAETLTNGWVLACVIDGVGGYEGGEVAAAIAKETILQHLRQPISDAVQTLKTAVLQANKSIYTQKQKSGANPDMACVLTVALADVATNVFYYAHVGDTRMYLLRDGSLVKVTKDQSFVGFLEDSGRLSEKEAMAHPKRNEINNALGFDGAIEQEADYIETGSSPFLPGDALLLCSDGLTDLVTNKGMTDILLANTSLAQKATALIKEANRAGGKDNITAVLVTNPKKQKKQKALKPVSSGVRTESTAVAEPVVVPAIATVAQPAEVVPTEKKSRLPLLIVSVLCLLLGAAAFWFWRKSNSGIQPAPSIIKTKRNNAEQALYDSLGIAQKTFAVPDSVAGKTITVTDTLFIRQDSLRINGKGLVLQADSLYKGPAFFVSANNRYLLLENMDFKNFTTAITTQSRGLQLQKVVFQATAVPVLQQRLLPLNDTLSGSLKDSFLVKKDSTHK